MIVGGFSKHQNKTSDTDRYDGYFFTTRVSEVNVNTMKRFFEQWSEFQVAKSLVVHVPSSSYNVSSLEPWIEWKKKQQWGLGVANDFVIILVHVSHESVCGQCS